MQKHDVKGWLEICGISVDHRYSNWSTITGPPISSGFHEVEFSKESGTGVHITSHINNLHPPHMSLKQSIEKLN